PVAPVPAGPAPAPPDAPEPAAPAPPAPGPAPAGGGVALDWNDDYPGAGSNVRVLSSVVCKLRLFTHTSRIIRLFRVACKVPTQPTLLLYEGFEIGGFAPDGGGDCLPAVTSVDESTHPTHRVYFDGESHTVSVLDVP